ncbi:hypothetical protein Pedsa_3379 [Pseudopedobacter saltans DSM 12145]|uniref:Nickel transport complex protein, NikM subunit, transmembrane n=1 Tax=Pseudopedobacter saltans (strain ATCC 51119 / DSM 12145 / JCM 21818 / CCUG 39354 / LMG 10337 / NBRC 100064 / NCIMB 13643) TaxID=762903 RepID=F0SDD1_PSESL|nr:DUF4198 domain-containing protein [Pseudopedobacter saltans]ADY53914.1 hypothetical protein Pedsa_3379 [Pseudopedobacter saltans DSM 12145]
MKSIKLFLLSICLLMVSDYTFAHALWIETNTIGKVGQSHEVKVYYGEYVNNERETTDKWYSDVKNFNLYLTSPGKESIKLETIAGKDFYKASFIPEQDGIYHLTIVHTAKDLGGTTKYEFSSLANVSVGKPNMIDTGTIANSLKISTANVKHFKVNEDIKVNASLNGEVLKNKVISVFSPSGWAKEYVTDEDGNITIKPIWSGRYVIEVSNREKVSGLHHGKDFTAAWQGATSTFEVK